MGYDLARMLEDAELALGYFTGQGVGEIFGTVLEGLYSHSELALYNTPGSNYILDEFDLRLLGLLFSARGIVWEANPNTQSYERVRMEGADKCLKSLKALADGFKPDVKRELCFSSRSPTGKRSNATATDGEEAAAETKKARTNNQKGAASEVDDARKDQRDLIPKDVIAPLAEKGSKAPCLLYLGSILKVPGVKCTYESCKFKHEVGDLSLPAVQKSWGAKIKASNAFQLKANDGEVRTSFLKKAAEAGWPGASV